MVSVIKALEDFRQLAGSKDVKDGGGFIGTAVRVMTVRYNEFGNTLDEFIHVQDTAISLDSGGSIPLLWDEFPDGLDPWMYCVNKTPVWISPHFWELTCNYSRVEEPLEQDDVWSFSAAITNEPIDHAFDDTPLLNSADEPFDPPIQIDVADLVIRIAYNRSDEPNISAYMSAVNSDVWNGYGIGTCKVKNFEATETKVAGLTFYACSIEIHVRDDKWQRKFLDQGLRKKTASGYELILGADGKAITTPVKLNGSGDELSGDEPVLLSFDIEKTTAFSGLGL